MGHVKFRTNTLPEVLLVSELAEIARVELDNLRYLSLSLQGNIRLLVYNIFGKIYFYYEGQKLTLLRYFAESHFTVS